MNRNKIILIMIVICILVITIFIIFNKKDTVNQEDGIKGNIETKYNNETRLYEIIDKDTGEIIVQTETEEGAEFERKFYEKHPTYRANPPVSPNVE